MKPTKMAALVLSAIAVVGMSLSPVSQRTFAHEFSDDESATFLVDILAAKIHLILVGWNLASPEAAIEHIEHINMMLSDDMLDEVAERNERIARDIPAALADLKTMIENGEDRSVIVGQFREIRNLLDEAVSVRIDRDHIANPQVKALIVAGLADHSLTSYEKAYGLEGSGHGHAGGHNDEDDHGNEHMQPVIAGYSGY